MKTGEPENLRSRIVQDSGLGQETIRKGKLFLKVMSQGAIFCLCLLVAENGVFNEAYAQRKPPRKTGPGNSGGKRPGGNKPGGKKPGDKNPGGKKPGGKKPGNNGGNNTGGNTGGNNTGSTAKSPTFPDRAPFPQKGTRWKNQFVGNANKIFLADDPQFGKMIGDHQVVLNRYTGTNKNYRALTKAQKTAKASVDQKSKEADKLVAEKAAAEKIVKAYPLASNKIKKQIQNLSLNKKNVDELLGLKRPQLQKISKKIAGLETQIQAKKDSNLAIAKKLTACDEGTAPADQCTDAKKAQMKKDSQKLISEIQGLQKKVDDEKPKQTELKESVASLKKQQKQAADKIAAKQAEAKQLDDEKTAADTKIAEVKIKLAPLNKSIGELRKAIKENQTKLDGQVKRLKAMTVDLNTLEDRGYAYRDRLITRVLKVNQAGVSEGAGAGILEGQLISQSVSNQVAKPLGHDEGAFAGKKQGEERDYKQGYDTELPKGVTQGNTDGETNGKADGRLAGHQKAARELAPIEAESDAQKSDAGSRGKAKGEGQGKSAAETDGKAQGLVNAVASAVAEIKQRPLSSKQVTGPYGTAFQSGLPVYPGLPPRNLRRYFNPQVNNYRRQLMRQSYSAGYRTAYRAEAETAYYANIQADYNRIYQIAYNAAYEAALKKFYQSFYDQGAREGFKAGYDSVYGTVYNNFKQSSERTAYERPNRKSPEFTDVYNPLYNSTYKRVYDAIYEDARIKGKDRAYKNLIGQRTSHYQKIYDREIGTWEKTAGILKFESYAVVDSGISGVGVDDGIFMPQETASINLKISNYGKVPAKNVKVIVNGKTVSLPAIPALTSMTLNNAVTTKIKGRLGDQVKNLIDLRTSLSGKFSQIQTVFHAKSGSPTVASEAFTTPIQLPLDVAGPQLTKNELLIGESNSVIIPVSNKSSKAISKYQVKFENINRTPGLNLQIANSSVLNGSVDLASPSFAIKDANSAYSNVTLAASIYSNGVLVGRSGESQFVVQARYDANKSIALMASPRDPLSGKAYQAALKTLGSKFSVFDITLKNRVQNLEGKTIVFFGNRLGGYVKAIEQMTGLKSAVVVAEPRSDYKTVLGRTKSLSNFYVRPYRLAGNVAVAMARPQKSMKDQFGLPMVLTSVESLVQNQKLIGLLKKSAPEVISEIDSKVNKTSLGNKNPEVMALVKLLIRAIDFDLRLAGSAQGQFAKADALASNGIIKSVVNKAKSKSAGNTLMYPMVEKLIDGSSLKKDFRKDLKKAFKRIKKYRKDLGGQRYFKRLADMTGDIIQN